MLDRGRRRRGGGDPYDDARRRLLHVAAALASIALVLVGARVGYAAGAALHLPPWALAGAGAAGCATIVLAMLWSLTRR